MSKSKIPVTDLSPSIEIEVPAGGVKRRVKVRTMNIDEGMARVVVGDASPVAPGVPSADAIQVLGSMARSAFGMR
jgi:hypothetical protein